ncbi:unnamed protein product [Clavelina lepadiformis]|uniref:Uncharacterized protein n=1 Tax=Clavelina lepadiformis TaxID=159417 RepID=A0ABP0F920_CLALP
MANSINAENTDNCSTYKITNAVLITLLVTLVLANVAVVARWKLKKRRVRVYSKNADMITIGRPGKILRETSRKGQQGRVNNNVRPSLEALHAKNSCPVVIPSIHVTDNDGVQSSTPLSGKSMTYAHIRQMKKCRAVNGHSTEPSKVSEEFAGMANDHNPKQQKTSKTVTSYDMKPVESSTPCTDGATLVRQNDSTYVSPVQYNDKDVLRGIRRPSQDSAEVFGRGQIADNVRSRIVSAFRSIPSRLSSTISAIGNGLPATTPTNSPKATQSREAIYLSFNDVTNTSKENTVA